jgi:SAM-dependent methyltransferase
MHQLTDEQKAALIARYSGRFHVPLFSYGTVRDYCDSCDHLSWLASVQNDLKDLQRPWTIKATLGLLPPPARLLEIGAGEPLVAAALAELDYNVTVVDPYDGSGGGPTAYEHFVQSYPRVRIIREEFRLGLVELTNQSFDGIYSVSVLEHIPEPCLETLFKALSRHLKPGGWSFHSVDCVIQGAQTAYHCDQCSRILDYQHAIAGLEAASKQASTELINRAHDDLETYYLSAAGHNLWRGALSYDQFPFRKVISIQFTAQATASAS